MNRLNKIFFFFSDQKANEAKQHGQLLFNSIYFRKNYFLLGNQAADNFRNAANETANRSGYGTSGSSSRSSSPSSSGQTTTDKIKDKASEFAEQAKSTV